MAHTIFRIRTDTAGTLFVMPAPPANTLEACINQCKSLGITTIVSLLGHEEAVHLGLANEAAVCKANCLTFMHHPIEDFGLPEIAEFRDLVTGLARQLEAGNTIALHCRAGIGRTGTTASCILQVLGKSAAAAIEIVSAARRKDIPDTAEQTDFIKRFAEAQQ